MKTPIHKLLPILCLAGCTALGQPVAPPPTADIAAMERLGVYVVSADLERSRRFYEIVFETAPELQTETFLGFNIAGGLFAVVSKETFAPNSLIGGNAVPYIKVPNVRRAQAHLEAVMPATAQSSILINEGYISLLKFRDPDGNLIEYYEIKQAE